MIPALATGELRKESGAKPAVPCASSEESDRPETVVCPLCESDSAPSLWATVNEWNILNCSRCGHRFASPPFSRSHIEDVYSDSYFFGGEDGYADYLSEGELLRQRGRDYADCLGRYLAPGSVLDVGAAAGFSLQGFIDRGWTGVGVEPNRGMADHAANSLRISLPYRRLSEIPADSQFAAVCLLQVIAHFVDLRNEVELAARAVAPGGVLLIETWDYSCLFARLLGKSWHEYNPPSVLHWFTPQTLDRLMAEFGCVAIAGGRPRRRIQAAHAKSALAHVARRSLIMRAASWPLRFVPDEWTLPYPGWDLFWRVYRRADS